MPGDFFRRFEIGIERRFFDVGPAGGPGRVDINGDEGLRGVDHDGAAAGETDFPLESRLDLRLDLITREQGDRIFVTLNAALVAGHHLLDEFEGLPVRIGGVDEHFPDVLAEVVSNGPQDDVVFLIDKLGRGVLLHGPADGLPDLAEVVQIPLEFLAAPSDPGGANDDPHALGDHQAAHGFPQQIALFPFNSAGDAAGPRIVGHEHQVTSRKGNKGGEGGAFRAPFFLVDLDNEFLAFLHKVRDGRAAFPITAALLEVFPGDFLQGEEAVAVCAVIHEGGFEAGLDTRDARFVNIGFGLNPHAGFDIEIVKLLPIDQRNPKLFGLGGVNQHPFHAVHSSEGVAGWALG